MSTAGDAVKSRKTGIREQLKEESRDRIRLAARKLLAERGYDATALRDIAASSGLSLGTIYKYISDKRDLIYLVFNEEVEKLTDTALAAPRPWQSFSEKMLSITEHHYRLFGGEPELSRILLSEVLQHTPGFHLERHLVLRARLIAGIAFFVNAAQQAGEIKSAQDADVIARGIFYLFSAALRWWLASPQPDWRTGQREFECVLNLMLDGLNHGPERAPPSRRPVKRAKVRASAEHKS